MYIAPRHGLSYESLSELKYCQEYRNIYTYHSIT